MTRAVIDTNVVVAALIRPRGAPGELLRRLRDGHFVAIVSRPILEEIEAVLARPWLRESTTSMIETSKPCCGSWPCERSW